MWYYVAGQSKLIAIFARWLLSKTKWLRYIVKRDVSQYHYQQHSQPCITHCWAWAFLYLSHFIKTNFTALQTQNKPIFDTIENAIARYVLPLAKVIPFYTNSQYFTAKYQIYCDTHSIVLFAVLWNSNRNIRNLVRIGRGGSVSPCVGICYNIFD